MAHPVDQLTTLTDLTGLSPVEKGRRIPIWHRLEQRKISGTAAPIRKNLVRYLLKNFACDPYIGQDRYCALMPGEVDGKTGNVIREEDVGRVAMWNHVKKRKLRGNSSPLRKNLERCLLKNPEVEIYIGQDRCGDGYHAPDCEAIIGEKGVDCIREDFQKAKEEEKAKARNASLDADAWMQELCGQEIFDDIMDEYEHVNDNDSPESWILCNLFSPIEN